MHIYIECMSLLHPIGKISASSAKKNAMGRCAFRKSQKSVQNCANQHRTLCAINNFFRLIFGVFYSSKIKKHNAFCDFSSPSV